MGKAASETSMRAINVEKLVLDVRVGERCDRSVRDKVLQQAEKNEDSATQEKSRESGRRRKENLQMMMMMMSSAHGRKQSKVFRKRTIKKAIDLANTTCQTSRDHREDREDC